ncbi:flagellar hook-associated protein FlgL [uncultured Massilia sp.]|uniref:flagellar hook-associated protein FlgL n=1 Tax=uncultured Massilia sp. TaxID=169973 RepID=UPI0025F98BCF|nr:flagellar hook-associated protein FlgL [uncultured Massilia sp.]
MRISSTQYQALMNQSLQKNQERITYLTQQGNNGYRIQVPSDDPIDSVRISRLKREEAAIDQYRDNIAAISQRMSKSEGYLTNMVNDMNSGRDLLVWAANGSNTPEDLNAMVTSLTSLRDSLLYTSNSIDQEGRYIFSGTATDVAPIAYDEAAAPGARYSYSGNTGDQNVVVANGITQVANQNLQGMEDLLNKLDATIATLSAPGVDISDPAVRSVVTAGLDGFDDGMNLLSSKVAVLGGQQNILKTLDANHANVSLSNQTALKEISQVDIATVAIELNGYTTALQATYKAYSKIGNLSLFAAL